MTAPKYANTASLGPSIRLFSALLTIIVLFGLHTVPSATKAAPVTSADTAEHRILLVAIPDSSLHSRFLSAFQQETVSNHPDIQLKVITPDEYPPNTTLSPQWNPPTIVVAVGTEAAFRVAQHDGDAPVLFALIAESSYLKLLQRHQDQWPSGRRVSAIFASQPIRRQLELLATALPHAERVGVLLGPASTPLRPQLQKSARALGLRLTVATVTGGQQPYDSLETILKDTDVVLAIPDPSIYNKHTIRNILITTFRYQKPLIGYSRAFVKAGALAALYSTPEGIGRQAADYVEEVIRPGTSRLPPPDGPREFFVSINYWVAESLRLSIDSEERVLRNIRKSESSQSHE